jgi:probable HAF family extracellular repeat protein
MRRSLLPAVLSLSLLLSALVSAHAATYTFTTFAVPDATFTFAYGINDTGQIVGRFGDGTGNHGFLWDGTTFTNIDVPDATFTEPHGINNLGQIVGSFGDFTGSGLHGFLKDQNRETLTTFDVPVPDATRPTVYGINDSGEVIGTVTQNPDLHHGFLIDGDTLTIIDVPDSRFTFVHGINHAGQIVGYFRDAGGRDHAFLTDGETFTTFDAPAPGTMLTVPYGLNDAGQMVGYFSGAGGDQGFLTDGDTFTTIAVPGGSDTKPYGINTAGQIVGTFLGPATYQGFVATPAVVDKTPPLITVSASPATLSPPNGRLVTVAVSGAITDGANGSGVQASTYQVTDEYGQIQPSGSLTLVNGEYAFSVALQASRRGNDRDGRRYTITVSATDQAGNRGDALTLVTVPHG